MRKQIGCGPKRFASRGDSRSLAHVVCIYSPTHPFSSFLNLELGLNKVRKMLSHAKFYSGYLGVLFLSMCVLTKIPLVAQESEQQLLAVLRSDASKGDKAITCKKLAVYGTESSVADLAKLLPDPELSSWARIALEAIPGTASKAALREAAEKLSGRLLTGVLNSLGVLRDVDAVELLVGKARDADAEVAEAAIAALGEIGSINAADAILAGLSTATSSRLKNEYALAAIRCADTLRQDTTDPKKGLKASELFRVVRTAELPKQRLLEATLGLMRMNGKEASLLLTECLKSEDKDMFRLGLTAARNEVPGNETSAKISGLVGAVAPERSGLIIAALADRLEAVAAGGGKIDLSPLVDAAIDGPKPVRLFALTALGRLGNVEIVEALLKVASEDDQEIAGMARKALAEIPGTDVNKKISALVATAEGTQLKLLVELVGLRRIPATQELVRALESQDATVRRAALLALGETVELKDLALLIRPACNETLDSEELAIARQSLRTAAVRMPQPDACADQISAAVANAPEAAQVFLIETLGEVGGKKALESILVFAKGSVVALQDAGSKVLGKWNNLADAEALLDYSRSGPTNQYRLRALKGYIALARRFAMPETDRVKMCRAAMDLAKQTADRKLVLDVLRLHPSVEGFSYAIELSNGKDAEKDSSEVAVSIAQKLGGQGIDPEKLKSVFAGGTVKLEIIDARYGAGETWQNVTELLKRQSGKLAWISLPATNYNQAFGGDPAPGVPKQLKIKYKMNDKEGEVALTENAMIILPVPK